MLFKIFIAIIAFLVWLWMMKNVDSIRNSRYWLIGFIGSIFLVVIWVPVFLKILLTLFNV